MTSMFAEGNWKVDVEEDKLLPVEADQPLSCDDCDFDVDDKHTNAEKNNNFEDKHVNTPKNDGEAVDILFQGYAVVPTPVNGKRYSPNFKHPNGCRCPLCQTELGYVPVDDPLPQEPDPIERIPIEFRNFYRVQNPEFVFYESDSPKMTTLQEVSVSETTVISYINRAFRWLTASQSSGDLKQMSSYSYMQPASCLRENSHSDTMHESQK